MGETQHPTVPPGSGIDASVPHSARVWNYWLGGKDHYEVDRELGDQVSAALPTMPQHAQASRAFLTRAVRYLVRECGLRQFLDLGTGLPTADNTHEIAQAEDPNCQVVYVDNDPLVLAHARALLTSQSGNVEYVDANLREPDTVVDEAIKRLDFQQPVGVCVMSTMGHLGDAAEAHGLVERVMAAAPVGSYLALNEGLQSESLNAAADRYNASGTAAYNLRTVSEVQQYFDMVELVEPGLVRTPQWRPDLHPAELPPDLDNLAGVGRKSSPSGRA